MRYSNPEFVDVTCIDSSFVQKELASLGAEESALPSFEPSFPRAVTDDHAMITHGVDDLVGPAHDNSRV